MGLRTGPLGYCLFVKTDKLAVGGLVKANIKAKHDSAAVGASADLVNRGPYRYL